MSVYSAHRSGDGYYTLYTRTQLKAKETRPGSEDFVTIYFNSNVATYYSTDTVGNYTNVRDTLQKNNGTIVFNFDDDLAGTNYGINIVRVKPKSGTSGKALEYAASWIHTYKKTEASGSVEGGISYGGKGKVESSVGVTVNLSSSESSWQRMEDNPVSL